MKIIFYFGLRIQTKRRITGAQPEQSSPSVSSVELSRERGWSESPVQQRVPDTWLLYERGQVSVLQHHRRTVLPVRSPPSYLQSDCNYDCIQLWEGIPRPTVWEEICQLQPGGSKDEWQVSHVSPWYRALSLSIGRVCLVEKGILYWPAFIS